MQNAMNAALGVCMLRGYRCNAPAMTQSGLDAIMAAIGEESNMDNSGAMKLQPDCGKVIDSFSSISLMHSL
jgi:hypothetical protein